MGMCICVWGGIGTLRVYSINVIRDFCVSAYIGVGVMLRVSSK